MSIIILQLISLIVKTSELCSKDKSYHNFIADLRKKKMKKTLYVVILSSLLSIICCHPLSYQKVKFVIDPGSENPSNVKHRLSRFPSLNRNSRSFGLPFHFSEFWPAEETVFLPPSGITIYDVSFERGHITPDYSNGLEYPDPLLLTGKDALIAVKYLYGKGELFYHQIPHIRALLRNQEERRLNGLEGNYLLSNRPGSPFYKDRQ